MPTRPSSAKASRSPPARRARAGTTTPSGTSSSPTTGCPHSWRSARGCAGSSPAAPASSTTARHRRRTASSRRLPTTRADQGRLGEDARLLASAPPRSLRLGPAPRRSVWPCVCSYTRVTCWTIVGQDEAFRNTKLTGLDLSDATPLVSIGDNAFFNTDVEGMLDIESPA